MLVFGTRSALAARQASSTIPIVVPTMQDPVRDGLVASLARPGGNVTGLTFLGSLAGVEHHAPPDRAFASLSHRRLS
jgi:hypothetical protein